MSVLGGAKSPLGESNLNALPAAGAKSPVLKHTPRKSFGGFSSIAGSVKKALGFGPDRDSVASRPDFEVHCDDQENTPADVLATLSKFAAGTPAPKKPATPKTPKSFSKPVLPKAAEPPVQSSPRVYQPSPRKRTEPFLQPDFGVDAMAPIVPSGFPKSPGANFSILPSESLQTGGDSELAAAPKSPWARPSAAPSPKPPKSPSAPRTWTPSRALSAKASLPGGSFLDWSSEEGSRKRSEPSADVSVSPVQEPKAKRSVSSSRDALGAAAQFTMPAIDNILDGSSDGSSRRSSLASAASDLLDAAPAMLMTPARSACRTPKSAAASSVDTRRCSIMTDLTEAEEHCCIRPGRAIKTSLGSALIHKPAPEQVSPWRKTQGMLKEISQEVRSKPLTMSPGPAESDAEWADTDWEDWEDAEDSASDDDAAPPAAPAVDRARAHGFVRRISLSVKSTPLEPAALSAETKQRVLAARKRAKARAELREAKLADTLRRKQRWAQLPAATKERLQAARVRAAERAAVRQALQEAQVPVVSRASLGQLATSGPQAWGPSLEQGEVVPFVASGAAPRWCQATGMLPHISQKVRSTRLSTSSVVSQYDDLASDGISLRLSDATPEWELDEDMEEAPETPETREAPDVDRAKAHGLLPRVSLGVKAVPLTLGDTTAERIQNARKRAQARKQAREQRVVKALEAQPQWAAQTPAAQQRLLGDKLRQAAQHAQRDQAEEAELPAGADWWQLPAADRQELRKERALAAEAEAAEEAKPAEATWTEDSLPVSLKSTMKELQAFAKGLGDKVGTVEGRTKPKFFAALLESLQAAGLLRADAADPEAAEPQTVEEAMPLAEARWTAATLPVSAKTTMKELQQFALDHADQVGPVEGRTKAAFFAALETQLRACGLLADEPAAAAATWTEDSLPVSLTSTMKELQAFAKGFGDKVGKVEGRTKPVFLAALCAELRAAGLLA